MKPKNLFTLFLILLFSYSCNNEDLDNDSQDQACDNGTFVGRVTLNTQQQVNEFGALCYTKIDGTLSINDLNEAEDKIVDLSPLINLREIYTETYPDSLFASFHFRTSLLTNFEGLNNLEKVGRLVIQENQSLVSFNGLESLTTIGTEVEVPLLNELDIKFNENLESLDGLNNLTKVGFGTNITRLHIIGNPSIQNIDGLESLEEINSSVEMNTNLWIYGNQELSNINGLSNLVFMNDGSVSFFAVGDLVGPDGCMSIVGNENLTSYCGIQNLLLEGDYNQINTQVGVFSSCYDYFAPSNQDIIEGNCSL